MTVKGHIFRLAIALTAFVFSVGLHAGWRYFQSNFERQNNIPAAPDSEPQRPMSVVGQNTEPESAFDAFGYYYLVDGGPKGFEDIDHLSIFTADYEVNQNAYSIREIPISPEGYVWASQRHKMTSLSIENGQMSFATETVRGISYQFSGRFLIRGSFYNLPQKTIVLEGRFIKIHKGTRIAISKVRFTWYEGH